MSHLSLAMPVQKLLNTYKSFGFGDPTGLGLTGESRGLMPQRRYWSDLDRATFAFGYGLMVTPLQLAHVYATIGSFGIYRPLSITRIDPPVIGTRVMPEALVHQVEHMMESVALPGGGEPRLRSEIIASRLRPERQRKLAMTANMSINMWPIRRALHQQVTQSSRWLWL